jgi:hypothetical protein
MDYTLAYAAAAADPVYGTGLHAGGYGLDHKTLQVG